MSASGRNTPVVASSGAANGAAVVGIAGGFLPADGNNNGNFTGPVGSAGQFSGLGSAPSVFNGATWDRLRTPNVLKFTDTASAGNTPLWTPAAGKKFRLMRFHVTVTANASLAAAGVDLITLNDGGSAIGVGTEIFVNNAAATTLGAYTTGWIDLGNGVLSAAANNVLNINLATALATGKCFVMAIGTEE